jgi:hypothetical protein
LYFGFVVGCCHSKYPVQTKTHRQLVNTGGGFDWPISKRFLGQQLPGASGRTHTTAATTLAAKLGS